MLLGSAAVFLGIAVVFGVLAYFRVAPQSGGHHSTAVSSVVVTMTMSVTPPGATSTPSAVTTSDVAVPPPSVITVTATRMVAVPAPSASGSSLGAIETLASTLGTVVAAACAVVALRPQGRARQPAPAAAPAGGRGPIGPE